MTDGSLDQGLKYAPKDGENETENVVPWAPVAGKLTYLTKYGTEEMEWCGVKKVLV